MYKSGDNTLANNYRPISLLCNASKMLEQLIYDKIYFHILKFIYPCQFRFLRNRSTVQQLLILLYYKFTITKCQTDVIYIRKAFDIVSHNELLVKLRALGISVWKALVMIQILFIKSPIVCANTQ